MNIWIYIPLKVHYGTCNRDHSIKGALWDFMGCIIKVSELGLCHIKVSVWNLEFKT